MLFISTASNEHVNITFSEDKSFIEVASPLLENFAHACAAPGALEKDDSFVCFFPRAWSCGMVENHRKTNLNMNPMNIQYFSKITCRSLSYHVLHVRYSVY